jgi:tRNA threonylcarbamoyl adenosine modification protein YeaZ
MLLFIDTSDNEKVTIALVWPNKVATKQWLSHHSVSEELISNIKKHLAKQKQKFSDIEKLAVIVGPGHFSRIRTGVVTANALGFALNVPIVGVKKTTHPVNLSNLLNQPGQIQVKPFYDHKPNISKPSPTFL